MEKYLVESLKTSSINLGIESKSEYQHKLLSNKEKKIVTDIRKELENCDEFIISVAFITEGGLSLILEQLKVLEEKGVKGKILTGDYLNFTQPKALKKLLSYNNIEVKLLSNEKFHAKGYFFRKNDIWTLIVGSSNLTQTALTVNFEWNLKVSSLEKGKIANEILDEFNRTFNTLPKLTLDMVKEYEEIYDLNRKMAKLQKERAIKKIEIKPNSMQVQALKAFKVLRESKNKGILISATGTGKTYLSAFDIKVANPKKVLFLAHRKTILEKSKKSFELIMKDKNMCIYGEDILIDKDIIFAMVQTLSKDKHLELFSKEAFDYIVVDEVHHSGAKSYQKILNYFKPKFLLGMTATPERSDDFDIYALFDHNIAYEIRLHDALKEELLCPFHYFGISDISIDGKEIDEKTSVKNLVIDERVNHIIEKSRYYGYSGEKLHGLIFASKVEEAVALAEKLTEKGIKSKALSGKSSDLERESTIEDLENGKLEYIVTVDIFNEGVDIPCVNQVIFLRPTESSIIYIQQLGRGLRKSENKEYVVILDFIGNYEKNFLIPTAISQNNSFDRDFMKRFLINGTNMIPGESSITFETIVKERIFENINKTNFSTKKNIEHDFNLLEKQLGRVPLLNDFFQRDMIEPSAILKFRKDYDEILKMLRPKLFLGELSKIEKNYLTFLSSIFTPSKRVHEMIILRTLLSNKDVSIEDIEVILKRDYSLVEQRKNIENAMKHLSKDIFTSLSTIKEFEPIVESEKKYSLKKSFKSSYEKNSYFKMLIDDLIDYNLNYVLKNYKQQGKETILRYKEYTKQQAFWNLNLDFNNGYQVSGYTIFEDQKKVIIFITLDDSLPFVAYDNVFYDEQRFTWFSKSNRCISRNGVLTGEGKVANNYYTIEVFLKKKSGENFFYLGEVEKVLNAQETLGKKGEPLVEYELKLKYEIDSNLFSYFNL
ncbi:DEAD/DEAH box helicase [Cetobacterium somerae]|uniref:DEAD/DEAH box helicase n=1 Tax=Cetobacterium somerae TaxID=188913 RepID=UPI00225A0F1E|nr:DEAD/DEAH box helicase [Cetobacterium somerae]MCX3067208.1 DEAD/DEAH box helicase [Cetobacterium somerae]